MLWVIYFHSFSKQGEGNGYTKKCWVYAGIPNPDRQEELFEVINQYKDPSTNFLDATNPDYLAAIDAVNQKYADNMFMTPQELEDSGFTGSTFNLLATGDPTTTTTSDPLSMGSNQGALSNLTDGTDSTRNVIR